MKRLKKAGYKPGEDIFLAMDVASSEIYQDGKYNLAGEGITKTAAEMVAFYEELVAKYPIISIEDGWREDMIGKVGNSLLENLKWLHQLVAMICCKQIQKRW